MRNDRNQKKERNVFVRVSPGWRMFTVVLGIGVLGGLLLIPVNTYAATVARGIPLLYAPVVGAWLLPVLTSMLTVRRPGAGIVAALVAGLVNVPTTSYGFRAVITMAMVGLFLELAVALTLYRRWDRWTFAVAIVVACVLYGFITWRSLDVGSIGLPAQLAFFGCLVLSGLGALIIALTVARLLRQSPLLGQGRTPEREEPVVTDGGWRYDGKSATKPNTTP